jgi:hemerythrin-like domain-containing protein
MNCRCIEILTAEHKTMLRMADVLDSMSRRARNEGTYNQEDVEAILHILRVFGDHYHQAKEESALFPVFATVCDRSEYAAVRHMLFELFSWEFVPPRSCGKPRTRPMPLISHAIFSSGIET